jgi:predicted ATPase/DNA-binding CsgD family transcriptional regulator
MVETGGVDGMTLLDGARVSTREAEVLAALGEHLTNQEIAARLFISVRTVESHVSSLLRKLGLTTRRELAELAGAGDDVVTGSVPRDVSGPPSLPQPLTSFVGRRTERDDLLATLADHRLVTAVGPGGVGKTRLALAVAAELRDVGRSVWFVDLVPVTEPTMVDVAVAGALGVPELHGTTFPAAIAARVGDGDGLLILDNCEHVLEGVAVLVEDLLGRCPRLRVLATSRSRLVLPFEQAYLVPGLSLPSDATEGDAVALFVERAAAAGPFAPTAEERQQIAEIAAHLDGVALAIELAAARVPTLGLDGIASGLDGRLRLLAGGRRRDDRHSSLRSAIDWSHALLAPDDRALLRRVAVFASPFTVRAAATVAGTDPVEPPVVADGLARLAEQSLLVTVPGATTHYRALETIRQYGEERLDEAGELDATRARHLDWCLATARALGETDELERRPGLLDAVIDDLRAALAWARTRPEHRTTAHALALELGGRSFSRGMPAESQRRYEQAAELADSEADRADALRLAAGAATARHHGDDALVLVRAAADAAVAAGDPRAAARHLAAAAMLIHRFSGLVAHLPPDHVGAELLAEARALVGDRSDAEALLLVAEMFGADESGQGQRAVAESGVELARRAGDVLAESAALDLVTAVDLAHGEIASALETCRARVARLDDLRPDPLNAQELTDCWIMTAETALATGDLATARRFAQRVADIPFLREEGHLAMARRIKVEALVGDLPLVVAQSAQFLEGWTRAGRPRATNLSTTAEAVVFVHGLRGDEDAADEWREVALLLARPDDEDGCDSGYGAYFESLLMLHRGEAGRARDRLVRPPDSLRRWYSGLWRPWYAAAWAEAAVLADDPGALDRVHEARGVAEPNPSALAIVDRAEALLRDDHAPLAGLATQLDAAGFTYQAARTRVLAGGDERAAGEAVLAGLGATPMVVG